MKLTLDLDDPGQLRRSLQSHIESEFESLSRFHPGVQSELSEPLASCLQEYYEQVHDERALEDPVLTLLLARSLWHLGEEELSLHYLDNARGASVSEHHRPLLKVRAPITPAIAQLVSLRVVRACSFISFGEADHWVLDLSRLSDDEHAVFELTRCMLLRKLLENIAPLFDPMDGGGGPADSQIYPTIRSSGKLGGDQRMAS